MTAPTTAGPLAEARRYLVSVRDRAEAGMGLRERAEAAEDLWRVVDVARMESPRQDWTRFDAATAELATLGDRLWHEHGRVADPGDDPLGEAFSSWREGRTTDEDPETPPATPEELAALHELIGLTAPVAASLADQHPGEGWRRVADLLEELHRALTRPHP